MGQTLCRVVVDGETIEEIISFDYTSDAMAIAEEAHFIVDNKGRKYTSRLKLGQRVEFVLQNDRVNGGSPTVKHRGVITDRNPRYSLRDGSTIAIASSDLGWHLQNCNTPTWLRLQGKTYADICDPAISPFFDPSWGFKGLRFDGDARRRLKLGLAAVVAQQQRVLDPVHVVQCEAGDTPAGKITEYARRLNLLLNVSPDGWVCLYRPNDKGSPAYSLRLRDGDALNNVLDCQARETARTRYTEVVVIGDQAGYEGPVDPNNPNATKKRGVVKHPGAVPFLHRLTMADGEMFANGLAQKQAEWAYKRGMFDSFYATFTVAEHFQGGMWWESDALASVDCDELGMSGNFWIATVRCTGSKDQGDLTEITVRMPGLLSASFGEIPTPSLFKASSIVGSPSAG